MLWMQETPDGLLFKIVVQPKGATNEVVGLRGDALKIKLTALPVDGAANKMLVQFLAKLLKVPKSDVIIVRGQRSRTKKVFVKSVASVRIEALL
jgi:uncharacterized protein (TIGR00251 family)